MTYKDKYKKYKQQYLITKFIPIKFQSSYNNYRYNLFNNIKYPYHSVNSHTIYLQTGGKFHKWHDKKDKQTHTFEMNKVKTKDTLDISVVTDDGLYCILVSVPWNLSLPTVIQNLSYYKKCSKEGLQERGGGDKLLRFMLDYLKINKKVYHIKRIILNDTSFKSCNNCSRTIKLSQLRIITHGETWYMKYGFIPYDNELDKEDKSYIKAIKYNNKVIDEMITTKFDFQKIIKRVKQTENINLDYKEIKRLADKYTNIRVFIRRLLQEFDKYCCFVNHILQIFYELKPGKLSTLINVHKVSYYLDI